MSDYMKKNMPEHTWRTAEFEIFRMQPALNSAAGTAAQRLDCAPASSIT